MDQTPLQQTVMETEETGASFPQEVAAITNDEPETTGTEERTYEPLSYDELFPALPMGAPVTPGNEEVAPPGNWRTGIASIASTVITQVFRVPYEERAKMEGSGQFGESSKETLISSTCNAITRDTGARIEISVAKDQSLTFLVNGKNDEVLNARKRILERFQTQARQTVSIPKEYHRFILGKKGKKLIEIENSTGTKIQVPHTNDTSEEITVIGTKETAERAIHEIQVLYDEQSKQMYEKIDVPAMYHPFINFNEQLNVITSPGNVRVNIPPQGSGKTELTIAGEKEGVIKCKEIIAQLNMEMELKCQIVSVEVSKSQHRHVIGPKGVNINEILTTSGVSVEMPPSDSPSETITLRGPQEKLGNALTMVYAKANSVVSKTIKAPAWLHKFIIGRKGANIKSIMLELPKVHVEFTDKDGGIMLEGPGEDVELARLKLQEIIDEMTGRLECDELVVDPQYYKHIIGKAGSNINRIRNDKGININIEEKDGKNLIRLEGNSIGVAEAKQELSEMVAKMENEIEAEIAIEQRFHRNIIGTKGDKIREIRDRFNQVLISIPDPGEKSDIVKIRGPKDDVEQCHKYLKTLVKELAETNFQLRVSIFKQFYKFIIGKSGVNINKIREETNTRLELPSESSNSDEIVITGKKENCLKARDLIQKIQSEMANIVEVEIIIPSKFHNSIIGAGGKLIQSISEECGGVAIKFPATDSKSDKVSLRGPKEDVAKAKMKLVELSNEKHLSSFTAEVRAKPQHHRYLIGKNGVRISKIRDKYGARIIFPNAKDTIKDIITIIGKKESVEQAKKELETIICELALIVEDELRVDLKHHRHFLAKRGEVIRNISDQFGGVTISFPRQGDPSDVVTIKGSKECVSATKARMAEMVEDLEQVMSIVVVIPQKNHRTVMGMRGSLVQGIQSDFNVHIKFPDKDLPYSENYDESSGDVRPNDMVVVQGKQEDCAKAREALLALVPISQEVAISFKYHRYIIGPKGEYVKSLMNEYKVNIQVPPAHDYLDRIVVSGPPAYVAPAVEAINRKLEEIVADEADRALRNYQIQVQVNPEYHPKIIGKKGAVISKIREKHGVNIQFKPRGTPDDDLITITGYESNCLAAKEAILEITGDLDNMIREPVEINHRIFSRLIGVRGRAIRKIMEKYKVEIRFPHEGDNPDEVTISGNRERVEECKDHLLNLAEEYLQDISDNEEEQRYTRGSNQSYQNANGDGLNSNEVEGGGHGGGGGERGDRGGGGDRGDRGGGGDRGDRGGGGERGDRGGGGDRGERDHREHQRERGGGSHKASKKQEDDNATEDGKGFIVQGAPWTQAAPNLDSSEDFPTMGRTPGPAAGGGPSIWGPRR